MKTLLFVLFISVVALDISSQKVEKWDNTQSKQTPGQCKEVEIVSTTDGKVQRAYFYKSKSDEPRPLVVSLHTWSGDYRQKDTIAWMCVEKDYNYIHPDFRGPNNTYEACGSSLVISDIDDAIDFALKNGNVDKNQIHITGVSGGGYATLLMYMKSKHNVRTFSAWAPISDLERWYFESWGRKNRYYKDIAKATSKTGEVDRSFSFDMQEARKRSPVNMDVPVERRKFSKLFIYAGIHDGYTGSVPITHSLLFFNKAVKDWEGNEKDLISDKHIIQLSTYRMYPYPFRREIDGRRVYSPHNFQGKVVLKVFDGSHEMLPGAALDFMKGKGVLLIGDSNGAIPDNWGTKLAGLREYDFLFNTSLSGNTIGFDNAGNPKLNTLKNVDSYLDSAYRTLGHVDAVVIMLGTNDCKAVFDEKLKQVPKNMEKLIAKIKAHPVYEMFTPDIYIVSPPPQLSDDKLKPKYHGGKNRIEYLIPEFRKIAEKEGCVFVDVHSRLSKFERYTTDGIHLNSLGQFIVGGMINIKMLKNEDDYDIKDYLPEVILNPDIVEILKHNFKSTEFRFEKVSGIGHEPGCTRRDNSDIIKVNDKYYIYYTKVFGRSPGYWGTIWAAVSEDEGHSWTELGEVLGKGEHGQWDSQAVFTPNVIFDKGFYYIYYTGVQPTPTNPDGKFENNSTNDFTAIGLAKSKSPEGPFVRCSDEPVLKVSSDHSRFDSYRIDDAVLMNRDGKIWLYYKGRQYGIANGPLHTKMGVAFADSPEGPFERYEGNPVLDKGHEVFAWPQNQGVACLASFSSTFEYALDGLDFSTQPLSVKVDKDKYPIAPGAYRPDLTGEKMNGLTWGISLILNKDESYLVRWELVEKHRK